MTTKLKMAIKTVLMGSALLASPLTAFAADSPPSTCELDPKESLNFYFGDLHVHTAYSLDSYISNNVNTPDDAYQFAMGKIELPIGTSFPIVGSKEKVKITRPLDFAAVTDHSETMAEYRLCVDYNDDANNPIYNTTPCQKVRDRNDKVWLEFRDNILEPEPQRDPRVCPENGDGESEICEEASQHMWSIYQKVANKYNKAENFTAFIAYEHSPSFETDGAFHRNVIFKGDMVPDNVISAYDVYTPSDLWSQLIDTCVNTANIKISGCDVMTIPHNPNQSKGMFFARAEPKGGKNYTTNDYNNRNRLEQLIEIHQSKGNSECSIGLGTADEFCQFELASRSCDDFETVPGSKGVKCLEDSYVRNGLKKGLKQPDAWILTDEVKEEPNELNPFKYGFIGSTDSHNGTPGLTDEFQLVLNTADTATPEKRLLGDGMEGRPAPVNYNPGGLAGVLAKANTRKDIFEALQCKRTFGTSGSRIRVLFSANWEYPSNLHRFPQETIFQEIYKGVPMGGDISIENDKLFDTPQEDVAPKFFVWAVKDPMSANLQRIQIVKGWEDTDGTHEKTYDVTCSDGLEPDKWTHRCPDNGAKVDLKSCSYSENKGAKELKTTWTDPDFDPSRRAFYYARVLENPTCRWSTYDANTLGIEPLEDVPPTIQERAWSSPIWYTPASTEKLKEIVKENGKKAIKKFRDILRNNNPFHQALLENRHSGKKLHNRLIEVLLRGRTVIYQNRRDGSTQQVFFMQKGKQVVSYGPDDYSVTPYEIRDDLLYGQAGRNNEYNMAIYRIKGESKFHYIACDSRDNGYCDWEILTKK